MRCALSWVAFASLVGCAAAVPLSPASIHGGFAGVHGAAPSYLYVADGGNHVTESSRIDIFLRDDPWNGTVKRIGKRVSYADGIFVDSAGRLYVANADESGNDRVTVYANLVDKPIRVYKGIDCAFDVAAASDGTVYVADPCGVNGQGRVRVYPFGGSKQLRELYPGGSPISLTVDSADNLYVGYDTFPRSYGLVKRYGPGSNKGERILPRKLVRFIGGIALDNLGELLVADQLRGVIDVFRGVRKPPVRVISTGQSIPFRFAFDRSGNRLYVSYSCEGGGDARHDARRLSSSGCGKRPNTVVALDYPSGKRLWTLREPRWIPTGVAVSPSAQH
jgi:DNA-binding beta-propeller fold protein YncE